MSREGDAVDTLLCVKEVMPEIAASDGDVSPTCTVKLLGSTYITICRKKVPEKSSCFLDSCRLGAGLKLDVSGETLTTPLVSLFLFREDSPPSS